LGRATHLAIIVDTSTSMAAIDGEPDRLADAKRTAHKLLAPLRRGDTAALIELSAEPELLAQASGNDTAVLLDQLQRLHAGGPDGNLERALNLAQATAQPRAETRVVVLTDRSLQATATQPVAGSVEWRTFGGEGDNTAIVAFAAQPLRNGGHQLYARVANVGTTAVARTLDISLDDEQVAGEPVRLLPGAEAEWSWPLPAGATRVSATMSGSDLQPLDDHAVVVLDHAATKRVLLVSDSSIALERALRAQPGIDVQAVATASYQPRDDIDAYVFVGFVPEILPDAPALIIAPPANQTLVHVGEQQFNLEADHVNDQRFAVLDWRPITFNRAVQLDPSAWLNVAVAAGDTPLVLTGQHEGQPVMIWTFDPADTNLANRIQFPLLTTASLQMLLPRVNAGLSVGAQAPVPLEAADGSTIAAGERITQPGVYQTANGALAVNAFDADEARLQSRPAPRIATVAQTTTSAEVSGRELWQPLVGAALLVLIAEWLYVHRRGRRYRRQTGQVT
jgi:hypothetical protein